MLKAFVLILHVANPSGSESTFAIDFDLSNSDCLKSALEWSYTLDQFAYVTCEAEEIAPVSAD